MAFIESLRRDRAHPIFYSYSLMLPDCRWIFWWINKWNVSLKEQPMSNQVMIVLIIALAVVIVLVVYRDNLSRFTFKSKWINAGLNTHNKGVRIKKIRQNGKRNIMSVERDDVDLSGSNQNGEDNELIVKNKNS
jgi:hypothetical protein